MIRGSKYLQRSGKLGRVKTKDWPGVCLGPREFSASPPHPEDSLHPGGWELGVTRDTENKGSDTKTSEVQKKHILKDEILSFSFTFASRTHTARFLLLSLPARVWEISLWTKATPRERSHGARVGGGGLQDGEGQWNGPSPYTKALHITNHAEDFPSAF